MTPRRNTTAAQWWGAPSWGRTSGGRERAEGRRLALRLYWETKLERRRAAAMADRAPHNMQPEPVTCGHGTRAGDHAAYELRVGGKANM